MSAFAACPPSMRHGETDSEGEQEEERLMDMFGDKDEEEDDCDSEEDYY
eukprot:CAMPEP_0116870844 /NCGR_PEP_ID=MMETSP0463-20121206/937_1 /TAXON_ID=181622 /ORGANISM="Strombidinopsis sp, Strain SopsisLIS2011" /LENGTH=48 /DNA_ID= /DNA_START= /DNA_END= /DNA_ORIENTATION=